MVTKVTTFVGDVLCMFIEKSLINSGLDKTAAKALAKSACTNIARPTTEAIGSAGGKLTGKVISKIKRKPSTYNKRYAAEYKRLAKKHPRLKFAALSKRTHKALRRK